MQFVTYFKDLYRKYAIDVVFVLLLGVVITFPLEKLNPIFIFSLVVVQASVMLINRNIRFEGSPFFWLLMALFALNVFGLLYSENLSRGFTVITRQISFVLFPLLYAVYRLKSFSVLFKIYVAAILCFILVFELDTLYRFFYKSDTFPLNTTLFLSYRYTGAELTRIIDMHNAYFGMYVVFSNVLLISFLRNTKKNFTIVALLLLIAFQSLFILQMVAKTAIILNILIVIPSLVYFLIKLKKTKILFFSVVLVVFLGWFSLQYLNLPFNRIADRFTELKAGDSDHRDTRTEMWQAAAPLIQQNLVFGVGTGDVRELLHQAYEAYGVTPRSNLHNQYLDYLLRFGLPGLLVFLAALAMAFFRAVKTNNYIYFCFTIIIMGCCLTENILSRQWGITFYACFNYLLYIYQPKKDT